MRLQAWQKQSQSKPISLPPKSRKLCSRRGGWSWYTGSAAWMYRAWVEEILGLKVPGETMQLDPILPGWWAFT